MRYHICGDDFNMSIQLMQLFEFYNILINLKMHNCLSDFQHYKGINQAENDIKYIC
jgi:hypothetical protein